MNNNHMEIDMKEIFKQEYSEKADEIRKTWS
jgi:hypothetical protein